MDQRTEIRLDYIHVKSDITTLSILCSDGSSIDAKLVNISSCGMMLSFEVNSDTIKKIPQKDDALEINIHNSQTTLTVTGTCMYTILTPEGQCSIGIFVVSATDQNKLYEITYNRKK